MRLWKRFSPQMNYSATTTTHWILFLSISSHLYADVKTAYFGGKAFIRFPVEELMSSVYPKILHVLRSTIQEFDKIEEHFQIPRWLLHFS